MQKINFTQIQIIMMWLSFVLPIVMWIPIKQLDVHFNVTYWHWIAFIIICGILGVLLKRGDFVSGLCITRFLELLFLVLTLYYHRELILSKYDFTTYTLKQLIASMPIVVGSAIIMYGYFNIFYNTYGLKFIEYSEIFFKLPFPKKI